MHQIQVDIIGIQVLERGLESLLDSLVPWVVELGCDPDLTARDARVLDPLAHFCFVAICQSTGCLSVPEQDRSDRRFILRINVAVAHLESVLHGFADFVGLRLPCTQTDTRHLGPGVQGEHRSRNKESAGVISVSGPNHRGYSLGAFSRL